MTSTKSLSRTLLVTSLFTRLVAAQTSITPPTPDPWQTVTAAIEASQPQFPNGLTLEVMTPAGVVFSHNYGNFPNSRRATIASASKWITATVLLRIVEHGDLSLDTQTKSLLVDRTGQPWSGNMGEIRLQHLLSFTAGTSSDSEPSTDKKITLEEAVLRIYDDQSPTASPPGSYFYYGGVTHMRIAARMAECATGLSWSKLFDKYFRIPLDWSTESTYGGAGNPSNPSPAIGLVCTGREYTRFLMMQLRSGMDGRTRFLDPSNIAAQHADAFGPSTPIAHSAYAFLGKKYHYGLGNWLETENGQAPTPNNPVNRWSSTGKFGWAPWIAADGKYAAIIMTQQTDTPTAFVPSENLKGKLDPLIRQALESNPHPIRLVP
ncbi:MAG: serine hydrolase [Verrucomicrobiota bacterium]